MMECPKCGFQQPEDQFCAQCGINIDMYKNKPIPKAKKLWNKLSFQISLTLVLATVLITVLYIKNNQPEQTPEQLSKVWDKEFSKTNSKTQLEEQSKTLQPTKKSSPSPDADQNNKNQNAQAMKTQELSEEAIFGEPQKLSAPKTFQISLVEAPVANLQALGTTISTNQGQLLVVEFDITQDLQAYITQLQQQDELVALQPIKKQNWHNSSFAQYRDQINLSKNAGYSTTITLRPQSETSAQLEVRTANTSAQNSESPGNEGVQSYTIPVKKNKAYAVFGFFPRPDNLINLPDLEAPNRVLSILTSPEFINGASDLALIFVLN